MADKPKEPMTEQSFQQEIIYKKDVNFHNEVEKICDSKLFQDYLFWYGIYLREVDSPLEPDEETLHYAFQDVLKALHDVYPDFISRTN